LNPATPPPLPAARAIPRARVSLRKVLLALTLAGSIVFFFLILGAGAVAVLREGSPAGHTGLINFLLTGKRAIARHIPHHSHHK
jgi:hypothetical protein